MNIVTPLILIIISIGTFFMYTDKVYRGTPPDGTANILSLQEELKKYDDALNNSTAVRQKRDDLQARRSKINPDDIAKLEYLLPNNIDNIKLIINMNNIGDKHNLVLKGIKLNTNDVKTDSSNKLGSDNSKYGTVGINFTVSASYDKFQEFLADLEKSLRLVEITDLGVTANNTGLYDFSVSLKTYWLK